MMALMSSAEFIWYNPQHTRLCIKSNSTIILLPHLQTDINTL